MTTMIGKEKSLTTLLQHLIELDYDAIEAYESAIERLENLEFKQKMQEFMQDHVRHTENLAVHLRALDEDVPDGPGGKHLLTKGKVVLADMMGDHAILTAMKSNEDDTNTAYERAVKHEEATAEVRRTLQENLEDERRHRHWLETTINERKKAA